MTCKTFEVEKEWEDLNLILLMWVKMETNKNNIGFQKKILSSSEFQTDVSPIWNDLEKIAFSYLKPALSKWFDKMDDVLFNQSEKIIGASQNSCLETLRWLRLHKSSLERSWLEMLKKDADLVIRPSNALKKDLSSEPVLLSLVENKDLEEDLAIDGMISRAIRLQGTAFEEYVSRIENLFSQDYLKTLSEKTILPWTPSHLVLSFQKVLSNEKDVDSIDAFVKILLYKHWEREVLMSFSLDLLSQDLQEKGIKSTHSSKWSSKKAREVPLPTSSHQKAQIGDVPPLSSNNSSNNSFNSNSNEEKNGLNGLLQIQTLQEAWEHTDWKQLVHLLQEKNVPFEQKTTIEKEDMQLMMHALHHLNQGNLRRQQNQENNKENNQENLYRNVFTASELKEQLKNQITSWTGKATPLKDHDELTLDLAAWLFEYIWQDTSLQPKIQAQLGRLQVPYVKAALADGRLLAEPKHAARRLLEKFVKWGQTWSESEDLDGQKIKILTTAIEQIVDGFTPIEADFEKTLEWFENQTQDSERRALVVEKRVQKNADGQEKLTEARVEVVSDLRLRLQQKTIPPLIEQFIRRPWAHHLVLLWLKCGRISREYREGVDWALGIISHFDPSPNAPIAHRFPLKKLKDQMFLAQNTLGIDSSNLERFWNYIEKTLYPYKAEKLNPSPHSEEKTTLESENKTESKSDQKSDQKSDRIVNPIHLLGVDVQADVWEIASKVNQNQVDQSHGKTKMQQWVEAKLPHVQNGVWWQLKKGDEPIQAIKMSWSGLFLKKSLFVNSKGQKAGEWTWIEMETMLNDGSLIPGQLGLFTDRAFDALEAERKNKFKK